MLAKELVAFVAQQARRARPGERFPGSTEALESCFGRFKQLEKQQARGGLTSLILGFGALLAETTTQAVEQAMKQSPTKAVMQWCKEHLGTTLFGRRQQAFAACANKRRVKMTAPFSSAHPPGVGPAAAGFFATQPDSTAAAGGQPITPAYTARNTVW